MTGPQPSKAALTLFTISFRLRGSSTDFKVRCRCEDRSGWRQIVEPYLRIAFGDRWNDRAGLWVVGSETLAEASRAFEAWQKTQN